MIRLARVHRFEGHNNIIVDDVNRDAWRRLTPGAALFLSWDERGLSLRTGRLELEARHGFGLTVLGSISQVTAASEGDWIFTPDTAPAVWSPYP
jgi:hypothetical protein